MSVELSMHNVREISAEAGSRYLDLTVTTRDRHGRKSQQVLTVFLDGPDAAERARAYAAAINAVNEREPAVAAPVDLRVV